MSNERCLFQYWIRKGETLMSKYKKIILGIDQSYTQTGISICADNELKKVTSIKYKGLKTKSEKRQKVREVLKKVLPKAIEQAEEVYVYIERIRLYSQGFISTSYLVSTGGMIASIVDTSKEYKVKVFSVDTRSWKSKVVGTSKGGKQPTVDFIQEKGFDLYVRTDKNGKAIYDDDAADSACIALYGFLDKKKQNIKLQE